jgi:hypothetical protein
LKCWSRYLFCLVLIFPLASFGKGHELSEGKLVLTASAMTDGYRTYKIAIYMGDRGALLWNHSGKFAPQANDLGAGDCTLCRIAQRLIDTMLGDCEATHADICQHQVPVHYRTDSCNHGLNSCLAVDFPEDPSRGLGSKYKTIWFITPIRPASEIESETRTACIGSETVDCGEK